MTLPNLVRFAHLKASGIVNSWPALADKIKNQGFPPGKKSGHTRIWTEDEIEGWLNSLPVATPLAAAVAASPAGTCPTDPESIVARGEKQILAAAKLIRARRAAENARNVRIRKLMRRADEQPDPAPTS